MKVSGLGMIHFTKNGKVIATRIKHNTNTDIGKQMVLAKLNRHATGDFDDQDNYADIVNKIGVNQLQDYEVMLFAVGSDSTTSSSTMRHLNGLVPLKRTDDTNVDTDIYFKISDKDINEADRIGDVKYSVDYVGSDDNTDGGNHYYFKKIETMEYQGTDSIKYVLRLENNDVVDVKNNAETVGIKEFGLYAAQVGDDGTIIDSTKVLFARLVESYDKTSSMGIVLEWIVTVS